MSTGVPGFFFLLTSLVFLLIFSLWSFVMWARPNLVAESSRDMQEPAATQTMFPSFFHARHTTPPFLYFRVSAELEATTRWVWMIRIVNGRYGLLGRNIYRLPICISIGGLVDLWGGDSTVQGTKFLHSLVCSFVSGKNWSSTEIVPRPSHTLSPWHLSVHIWVPQISALAHMEPVIEPSLHSGHIARDEIRRQTGVVGSPPP